MASELLLPQVATAAIELVINKALTLNGKPLSFSTLTQKTLTLELTELSFPLSFSVSSQNTPTTITVTTLTANSDCTIQTSLQTLRKLKDNQSLTQLIKEDELDVVGDIKVAQKFATLAQSLEIDWQTELAKHLGDVPTHKLLHFGNKITKSLSATGKKIEADVTEYLVHEKRLVVPQSQINAFNLQVKGAADKVDALSQRIDKLLKK